jgi:hypothetical protein
VGPQQFLFFPEKEVRMSIEPESNNHESPSSKNAGLCHTIRFAAIKAVIFRRIVETRSIYDTKITRLYVDNDGNWRESTSFGRDDLLVAAKVADAAHSWICLAQQKDRQQQAPESAS